MTTDRRREKETLLPGFADEVECDASERPTLPPSSIDPDVYARIVEAHVDTVGHELVSHHTLVAPPNPPSGIAKRVEQSANVTPSVIAEALGREMYGSYLASNFPEALVLAERVLEEQPDHALAQLVAERCRVLLGTSPSRRVQPSSVFRLKRPASEIGTLGLDPTSRFMLGHVDGITNAETIATILGVSPKETLDRLHSLLELGVVELVA